MTESNDAKSQINFDEFRKPWELDDYWHLKRQFLETYQDEYEFDRLQALAQTFINIEVMGNTYDETIMALIRRLTEDWETLKQFRENKQIHISVQKKNLVKSTQVENERKRLKTDMNNPEGNNRSFGRRDNRSNYNNNRNYNNNYNKKTPYTFGNPNVYSNDAQSYNKKRY